MFASAHFRHASALCLYDDLRCLFGRADHWPSVSCRGTRRELQCQTGERGRSWRGEGTVIDFRDVMGGVMLACCPELRFASFEFKAFSSSNFIFITSRHFRTFFGFGPAKLDFAERMFCHPHFCFGSSFAVIASAHAR